MADLLLVCARTTPGDAPPSATATTAERVRRAALLLAPAAIEPHQPEVLESDGVLVAVANPQTEGSRLRGDSGRGGAYVGVLFGAPQGWWRVGADPPDGTCALMRWDARAVQLHTDACASRALWYALTDEAFLASTSQRALVALLGSFDLEPQAVSWMLSAGTLGPEVSWDARLRRMPPDARLTLDRSSWDLDLHVTPVYYRPTDGDRRSNVARVRDALSETCAALELALERWPLALSGGVDSRALLAVLVRQGLRPRCITWTTRASLRDPLSDVSVARLVAARVGVEHEILVLDPPPDGAAAAVERFVAAGEGMTDEFSGYVDGLAMWRDLFRAGVRGVLRSDEAYGTYAFNPATHQHSRCGVGGAMVDEYPQGHVIRSLSLAPQTWPERLRARPDEDRLRYRVRLIHQAWNPIQGAGLNALKARYVEVAAPHLSRRVLDVVRTLPAPLLRGKATVSAISRDVTPLVPTSRASSTASMGEILAAPDMAELLVRELLDPRVTRVLPGDDALRVLAALVARGGSATTLAARARRLLKTATLPLPKPLVWRCKPPWTGPDPLSAARLAFRVLLASQTPARLEGDARALRDADAEPPRGAGAEAPRHV